jgi:NADH dehydrogenase (ubiquinone) flavoprotein 2
MALRLFTRVSRRAVPVRSFRAATPRFSDALSQHLQSDHNTPDTPFEWTEENLAAIPSVLAKYPSNRKQSAVMPLLQMAQKQNDNWLPLSAMNKIAELLDIPPMRVYEVATFYTMYNREPLGKYHLQVCGTTHCLVCGADKIMKTCEDVLGIKMGETTKDGLFTLQEVECLGACVNAPMLQINNEWFYENLDEANTTKLLNDLKEGKEVKPGPQIEGLRDCEGPLGQTNLLTPEKLTSPCRDFDALKAELEAKAKESAEQ